MLFSKIVMFIIGGFILLVLFVFIISCMLISTELETYEPDDKE